MEIERQRYKESATFPLKVIIRNPFSKEINQKELNPKGLFAGEVNFKTVYFQNPSKKCLEKKTRDSIQLYDIIPSPKLS